MRAMVATPMPARATPNQKKAKRALFDKLKKVTAEVMRAMRVARKKQRVR